MNVKHMPLGNDLGLTLEGYVNMGIKEAMKGRCILCKGEPEQAGVCAADGSDEAREMLGTPNTKNPFSHRLVFWAICGGCKLDPDFEDKIKAKVLQAVKR